ncbi:MAG TPA: bifunctional riboflavin kinase/FAD synthetase [candidate division Zixibacteria bacterium]|nr:bifunctional riboflavin kinase/FAD synthetase [candidate division Zixibacteria bacterium]
MEVIRHLDKLPFPRSVVTMGNFDGIHLGHQALLRNAVADARKSGCPAVVLTFEPHPLKVLAPHRAPKLLLTHKDKMRLLQSFGVDAVVIQNFDVEFSRIEAETFAADFLAGRLKVQKLWVGRDLRFGRGRRGRVDDLIRWGERLGFEVGVVEPIMWKGSRISSSRIRRLIEEGEVEEAKEMLGRYHFISGRVVGGNRRGRDLGFPTANVASRTEVLPADGVYATLIRVEEREWPSVTSIGTNPTFGAGPRTVECFIFDFDRDIYEEPVTLSFVKRIREERKFDNVEDLIRQMETDVERARAILNCIAAGD